MASSPFLFPVFHIVGTHDVEDSWYNLVVSFLSSSIQNQQQPEARLHCCMVQLYTNAGGTDCRSSAKEKEIRDSVEVQRCVLLSLFLFFPAVFASKERNYQLSHFDIYVMYLNFQVIR